eukprot:34471-Eustigmatos_ZCMA.PRE.1
MELRRQRRMKMKKDDTRTDLCQVFQPLTVHSLTQCDATPADLHDRLQPATRYGRLANQRDSLLTRGAHVATERQAITSDRKTSVSTQ